MTLMSVYSFQVNYQDSSTLKLIKIKKIGLTSKISSNNRAVYFQQAESHLLKLKDIKRNSN